MPSLMVIGATESPKKQTLRLPMVKKATRKPRENVGGRPRQDPATLRTERLVIRVHPDLMGELTRLAGDNGITRSLLVERSMIALVNQQAVEPILDHGGRRLVTEAPTAPPLGTPDSFNQLWSKVIGGAPAPAPRRGMPRPPERPPGWKPPQPPPGFEHDPSDFTDDASGAEWPRKKR
ncbi:MAG: hypothetical protein J0H40_19325 [Rhizobiales bacterium]|nr:hypothetical protein [Hyphomicrobiales bacterium]